MVVQCSDGLDCCLCEVLWMEKKANGRRGGVSRRQSGGWIASRDTEVSNYVETNSKLAQKEISHPAPVFDGKSREAEN